MENASVKKTVLMMLLGLGINYIGREFAVWLTLPLWLDSIGTGITAGLMGPIYGALCGFTSNILYGVDDVTQIIYALTNVIVGLVVGYFVKKGMLEKFFGVFNLSAVLIFISVMVSTVLSCVFLKGFTGNVWGIAVMEMLQKRVGWSVATCSLIGQIFIETPDKFIMILCVYLALRLKKKGDMKNAKNVSVSAMLFLLMAVLSSNAYTAKAAERDHKDTFYSSQYSSTIYSNNNGLGAGEANAIAQTTDGYLWIGTYAGLYSYDGIRFELRKELGSVKNVNCLYVDEPGRLWIGTNDSGVTLLVKGKVSSVLSTADGLPADSIRCISAGADGNYYIGTSNGLSICSIDNGLKILKTFDQINYATKISVDEQGRAVIINNEGKMFLVEDMEIRGVYEAKNKNSYYTSGCFLRNGKYIVADSKNRFYSCDINKKAISQKQVIGSGEMQNLNYIWEDEDRDNYLWLCFDNGIAYIDEKGDFYRINTGEFNSSIDQGMMDYQGNIWFTSSRLGLLKISRNTFADVYRQVQLAPTVVNSVIKWKGMLYSGTDSGLDIIDLQKKSSVENHLTKILKGARIRCLQVDSKNHLWICVTDGKGLYEVSPDGAIKIYNTDTGTLDERFRSIIELSDGTMAVAENTGLTFIKNGKVEKTLSVKDGLVCPQILSLLEASNGDLLAGSDGNGIFIIRNNKVMGRITRKDGLSSDVVLRITKCSGGYLIVTANGLCYMNQDGKIKKLDKFPYFNNYDTICLKNKKVWVLGSAGFYVAREKDLLENKEVAYELLDRKSGFMSSITVNSWSYLDEKGNAYYCCNTGIYSINVYDYNTTKCTSRMRVDSVEVDDTQYYADKNKTMKISGSMKKMVINPVVFNYTLSNPNIRYYLQGFEDKKMVIRQSELTPIVYTNLPAGKYTFHMELLDSTQEKVIEKCSYNIEKKREVWENWWFTVYFVVIGVFIVVFITYLVTKNSSNRIIDMQKREIEFARKQAQMGNETILAIAKTVDAKDDNTSQHSERVAEYSVMIAKRLGFEEEKLEAIRKVALLHDIGKIGIPDAVLKKPDRLTDEEYKIMKSHVIIGGDILKDFSLVENVSDGAKYHHERYDGKGYVMGLKGKEIPINARIIGVADAFDAMTSNRVYRKHLDIDYVISELEKGKGKQFDPEIAEIMLSLIRDGSIDVNKKYAQEASEEQTLESGGN